LAALERRFGNAALQEPPVFDEADRRLTLISVLIIFLLSAMSQTVVATAMPRIVSDLSGLHLYAWATTAYLLASTVMVPIWGKLGDIFGRKPVLLWGIGVFLTGSWLCGLAGEFGDLPLIGGGMTQLITARALQGIGGGALFTIAFAIIADLYAPRERAKFSGLFGSVFGVASIFGPVIGGFFTDHGTFAVAGHVVEGWRWVFYVNVPFALAAVAMITLKMPALPPRGEGRIDYAGAALIVVGFTALLLAITWGGREYAWASPLMPELMSSLPISGQDGTLRPSRWRANGNAHLKTGSLRDVASVAGIVHAAGGRRYVLVAMVNHPNAGAARPAMEALVEWVAQQPAPGRKKKSD
jgi:MFS family permease